MKIGILGGVFNPVHNGHIRIVRKVKLKMRLDKVVLLPSGKARHKEIKGAAPGQRYKMACLAADGLDWLEVSDFEIKESGRTGRPVATINILRKLRRSLYINDEIFFIIGSDEASVIKSWKDPEKLLELCSFIVVQRPGFKIDGLEKRFSRNMKVLNINALDISASNIRKRVEVNASFKHLVPTPVAGYIKEKGLYGKNKKW